MPKSKLDPRTAAAEKRMVDAVMRPFKDIELPTKVREAANAKALEDMYNKLLTKSDDSEKD